MKPLHDILEHMDYGPSRESDHEAQAWLTQNGRQFGLYINGQWHKGQTSFDTLNPADGQALASIAQATAYDVDLAVVSARQALASWQALSCHRRARYLYALARLLQRHARLLAVLETLDNGKPIRESRDVDVPLAIRHFYHHAGWAQLLDREFPQHRPVGVVGQIVPWNFPLLMLAWKIAPALAAGNTVVFKPAENTPLTALLFAQLCQQAGLPPGVVNVITGDGDTGAALVDHPGVDKLAFTGSTEVGREIIRRTAGSGKKLALELGGKSPMIVFDDADIDAAVEGVIDSIYFNQGQVCCAGSRLLLQESIESNFIAKLRDRLGKLRIGHPLDKSTDMGSLVSSTQLQRVNGWITRARADGCTVWQPESDMPATGNYCRPTLITGSGTASAIVQAEVFGPVLVSMSFRTPAEAAQLANNTEYGLAASIWTETTGKALELAHQIKAGVVWVNSANQFDAAAPFGGVRASGFGREGGHDGMLEYLQDMQTETLSVPLSATSLASGDSSVKWVSDSTAESPNSGGDDAHDGNIHAIDRTPKLYIGGKQQRPDGGYSLPTHAHDGRILGEIPAGQRKDIRNAVEAAYKQQAWAGMSAHQRAQILYYLAENLDARCHEFGARLTDMTGNNGVQEVDLAIERLFEAAAYADKFDGRVTGVPAPAHVVTFNRPVGVIGILCPDEWPLLGMIALAAPAIAMGNRVVLIPSARCPLIATDFYQVLDTSDVPGGVLNIVTGHTPALLPALAGHAEVDAVWCHRHALETGIELQHIAAGTLKRTWIGQGPTLGAGWATQHVARHATYVKTVWLQSGA